MGKDVSPSPSASCSLCGLGESGGRGDREEHSCSYSFVQPTGCDPSGSVLLRVREEFVVPEPSLGSSAGTTDDGAHPCDRVCISPAPGQPN